MTPIETYKWLKKKNLDLKEVMILERLDLYDRPILTGQIVTDATSTSAFASQATVFKYLASLKKKKFIKECGIGMDARCTYIQITNSGKGVFKEWFKVGA